MSLTKDQPRATGAEMKEPLTGQEPMLPDGSGRTGLEPMLPLWIKGCPKKDHIRAKAYLDKGGCYVWAANGKGGHSFCHQCSGGWKGEHPPRREP